MRKGKVSPVAETMPRNCREVFAGAGSGWQKKKGTTTQRCLGERAAKYQKKRAREFPQREKKTEAGRARKNINSKGQKTEKRKKFSGAKTPIKSKSRLALVPGNETMGEKRGPMWAETRAVASPVGGEWDKSPNRERHLIWLEKGTSGESSKRKGGG